MRAIYLKGQNPDAQLEIQDKETLHHLTNVIRLQAGDSILLLNGLGFRNIYLVKQVERKKIRLDLVSSEEVMRPHRISICLGLPKKEYFEDIIRSCIQLGIEEVFYFESEYSPKQFKLNIERMDKILKSSYEQSNNAFDVRLTNIKNIDEIVEKSQNYKSYVMCVPKPEQNSEDLLKNLKMKTLEQALIAIGPEGGFSEVEEKYLLENNFSPLTLPTFILKSTQAVPAGVGALLSASVR